MIRLFQGVNIKTELKAGIASAIVTLPIAIAFGQASGLGVVSGLYCAIIVGFFGAILGGTPIQISCPVGVVVVAVIYISNQHFNLSAEALGLAKTHQAVLIHALPHIFLTFLLAGLIQVMFGALRIGGYISYIPYPVISGFSTGIGLLIILLQLKDLFGFELGSHHDFHLQQLLDRSYIIEVEHAVFIVAVTLIILVFLPKYIQSIPAALVALILASFIPYLFNWENVQTIGSIDFGLQQLDPRSLWGAIWSSRTPTSLVFALTLALVNSINSLLTSVAADNVTGMEHSSNQELIGQGIGNAVASLFGAIPGGGAIACTLTNIHYGAKTRWSAVTCALVLLAILLLASNYLSRIPVSVLDGILLYVGYLIIDKKAIRQIKIVPWMDTLIMLVVIVLTTMGELVYAVIAGVSIASIYFMKRMADTVELDTRKAKVDRLIDHLIATFDHAAEFNRQVLIKNIKGPIFFGFASRFSRSLKEMTDIRALVLNMSEVSYIDQSGLYTLERDLQKLDAKKVAIYMTEVDSKIKKILIDANVIGGLVSENNLFSSVEECVMKLYQRLHFKGESLGQEIYVPPAFTPNHDGINDLWEIENLSSRYPGCEVSVFTREGEEVYFSRGYAAPWNGKAGGQFLSPDKYKYRIALNDEDQHVCEGYVSIFR